MGFIRGSLIIILSIMLLVLFLAGNIFLTLALSLKYNNINHQLKDIILDVAENEMNLTKEITENYPEMQEHCLNNTEYVFKHEKLDLVFATPCEIVAQGTEKIIEFEMNKLVEKIYYEDYDCGFFKCLKETETPFFLLSEKAQKYWQNKFYFSLFVSVALIFLIFVFIHHRKNTLLLTGALLIISSLPFMKLDLFFSFSSDKIILKIISAMFSQSQIVFWIMFFTGIFILGFGIASKFWNFEYSKEAETPTKKGRGEII